jgi:hypothetical protein
MRSTFTKSDDQFIRANFETMSFRAMAKTIGRSKYGVMYRLRLLGLVRSAEANARFNGTKFNIGSTPWNKGKKIVVTEAMKHTFYKKGNTPANTLPDNSISLRFSKEGRPYMFLRISKNNWKHIHVCLWEHYHGRAPEGYVVVFKNKDTLDVRIENLELITREELMKRNTIHNYPEPVKNAIRALGKLKKTIKDHGTK